MSKFGVGAGVASKVYVGAVAAKSVYLGAVKVWSAVLPLLSYADDFNRANQTLSATDYDYYTISPYLNLPPVIISSQVRAADPGTTSGNTVFGLTAPKYALSYTNRRVEFDLTGAPNATAQCGLVARATDDLTKSIQLNVVAATHGGFSSQVNLTATNRTSYDQAMVAAGDTLGVDVYGDTYIAYRKRAGVRLHISIFQDTGGAIVPLTAKRYGFFAMSTRSGVTTYYGATFDNFKAWDLPDRQPGDFIETGIYKDTVAQTWPVSTQGWVQVTGWLSHPFYPGSALSGNAVVVRGNKTGANIIATVPFTGAILATRQHQVRVMKNGVQIGISSVVAGNAGTCIATATADVANGDLITVEASGPGSTSGQGNVQASTPSITIT